ncbi:MAG: helix-turn-helix domain-containing protein [Thermoproteota archaeon]
MVVVPSSSSSYIGRDNNSSSMDSGAILDILGNDTRRRILAVLSRQPMYFNQLAKEVDVGQQAVLRHMQALEGSGMVEAYSGKSDLGAPDRKYYRLNASFVLTVSLSEDVFSITHRRLVESRQKESRQHYERFDSLPKETGRALAALQSSLAGIEEEISDLESRLNDLRALKQLVLHRLHEIGQDVFDEEERGVLYKIVEESPRSVSELSGMLNNAKEARLKAIMATMGSKVDRDSARVLFKGLR